MTSHVFDKSLPKGKEGESALDRYFQRWFHIHPARIEEEQAFGFDRIFVRRDNGKTLTIEYKSDDRYQDTGNAFIETTSVDSANKPGWAKTCKADLLCYYLVADGLVYAVKPDDIRAALPVWEKRYPVGKASNDGYTTIGLLVPMHEFKRIAFKVLNLNGGAK